MRLSDYPYKLKPVEERFWAKVEKTSGCWEWVGAITDTGYGLFGIKDVRYYAHRLSYEDSKGQIKSGLEIDHLCRNTKCVNPDHLEAVTPRENKLRGTSPMALHARKIACPRGHAYNQENTYYRPGRKGKFCKKCPRVLYVPIKKRVVTGLCIFCRSIYTRESFRPDQIRCCSKKCGDKGRMARFKNKKMGEVKNVTDGKLSRPS